MIKILIEITMNMLTQEANKKEGREKELFIKKYVSLIEYSSELHALEFVEDVPEVHKGVLEDTIAVHDYDHDVLHVSEKNATRDAFC